MGLSDLWLPICSFVVILGAFFWTQLAAWNSTRVLFGGDLRFAQIVTLASSTANLALVVTFLTIDLKLTFLEGLPFVLSYSVVLFSFLLIPALLVVEITLVIQLTFTQVAGPTARRWHPAALGCCGAWTIISFLEYWLGSR